MHPDSPRNPDRPDPDHPGTPPHPVDHRHVEQAVAEMLRTLGPHTHRDWDTPAGPLTWTCRDTAAHIAHDLLAYAAQLTARPDDAYLPVDLTVRPDATPRQALQAAAAAGRLLAAALATAHPETRAWHWGPCDPTGFAAMGVAETLLHTHDITQGLDVPWQPPADLAEAALRRLFPDAPPGDPAQALLWCTGRTALPDRPRRTAWTWQAALPEPPAPR
ncbi:maleylpyruvate isomerase N-terminal domain-containing protein [Streptacidiphilus sp. ASG 303]|uniref:maleylpyruvate isomerase N-terminal domain-containing protein n=1 Tax=Streptacidiphilus sp. ASG 303 TaxID=2896847 RepID=UPI001E5F90EC|nr:maleylpyruvate isomerase N-terminal domain-containing protein [Streptacidiphilus sp. ASG 303]MCD0483927.1 maleylpyruvate isomerase N-terminal domain-containing protein [Streptacidiphilus sp. ASG 303]